MNTTIILIERNFPLTEEEAKRLQKKYPFLTDNRILEIRENLEVEEVTGTIVDPVNKTLYPFYGDRQAFTNTYRDGKVWKHAKFIVPKEALKHDSPDEVLAKHFTILSQEEIDYLLYYLTHPGWAGAVVNTDPDVREKRGEFIIFPYAYSLEKMMDLYPEAELIQL